VNALLIKALIAYLLGSVIGSLVICRMRGVDIRSVGSGNPGATNALRTQGKAVGLTVLVIDMLRGGRHGSAAAGRWLLGTTTPRPATPGRAGYGTR
jgi:glycerol-3-phosphate acyltransferase PlsY